MAYTYGLVMIPCVQNPNPDFTIGEATDYTDAQLQTIQTAVDTLNARHGTTYNVVVAQDEEGDYHVAGPVLADETGSDELTPAMCALIPTLVSDLRALLAPHGYTVSNATVVSSFS